MERGTGMTSGVGGAAMASPNSGRAGTNSGSKAADNEAADDESAKTDIEVKNRNVVQSLSRVLTCENMNMYSYYRAIKRKTNTSDRI